MTHASDEGVSPLRSWGGHAGPVSYWRSFRGYYRADDGWCHFRDGVFDIRRKTKQDKKKKKTTFGRAPLLREYYGELCLKQGRSPKAVGQ